MKFLVVGLGNPGTEYEETRHNIGFKVLDTWASGSNTFFASERLGMLAELKLKGRSVYLLKPNTYMNLSGKAVNYWLQQLKLTPASMLVITDDLALPFGTLRMKGKGSDGGHNGLKDIQQVLGSAEYPRLRFGIGAEFSKGKQVDYVLVNWSQQEREHLPERLDKAVEAAQAFVLMGLSEAMNRFNGK